MSATHCKANSRRDGTSGAMGKYDQRSGKWAQGLAGAFGHLSGGDKLMVWCGWSHYHKRLARLPDGKLELMGSRLRREARMTLFCVDQCLTVRLNSASGNELTLDKRYRRTLERYRGTGGFLVGVGGNPSTRVRCTRREVDAVILSLDNEMR